MNQWMPRFGFTYSPFKGSARTVIRGHVGIFYAATPMLVYGTGTNNFRVPPGDLSLFYTASIPSQTVYQVFRTAGVDLNNFTLGNLPVLTADQATKAIASVTGAAPNPYLQASFHRHGQRFREPARLPGRDGDGPGRSARDGW